MHQNSNATYCFTGIHVNALIWNIIMYMYVHVCISGPDKPLFLVLD